MVTSPGRLRILTALAAQPRRPFVELRRVTGLTDGNLATHARRLAAAGFVSIEKSVEAGKPLTTLHLTVAGRNALADHAQKLLAALEASSESPAPEQQEFVSTTPAHAADDWVD